MVNFNLPLPQHEAQRAPLPRGTAERLSEFELIVELLLISRCALAVVSPAGPKDSFGAGESKGVEEIIDLFMPK